MCKIGKKENTKSGLRNTYSFNNSDYQTQFIISQNFNFGKKYVYPILMTAIYQVHLCNEYDRKVKHNCCLNWGAMDKKHKTSVPFKTKMT